MRRGLAFAAVMTAATCVFAHVACSTFDSDTPAAADASTDVVVDATTDALAPSDADTDTTVLVDPGEADGSVPFDAAVIPDGGKIVFVSKEQYRGGQLGGRDNADVICTNLAHNGGLDGDFVAFLRTATAGATGHTPDAGTWYRVDGMLAFSGRPDPLVAPAVLVDINEYGFQVIVGAKAWTAANGENGPDGTCAGWSDITAGEAVVGSAYGLGDWANSSSARACSDFARLYCFQK